MPKSSLECEPICVCEEAEGKCAWRVNIAALEVVGTR